MTLLSVLHTLITTHKPRDAMKDPISVSESPEARRQK